jgi:short chain dehydrogenase.
MTDPILITGGATRLGYALAMHYINNSQPVVITYRSQRPEVDKLKSAG